MACVDWLEATFPEGTQLREQLPGWAGLESAELSHGRNGYRRAVQLGPARVDFDGRGAMGIHLTLTGKGCREAEARDLVRGLPVPPRGEPLEYSGTRTDPPGSNERPTGPDWPAFAKRVLGLDGKTSRADVAMDFTQGELTIDQVEAELRAGRFKTRWKTWQPDHKYSCKTGERTQAMIRLGSHQSDAELRIYDKGLEQGEAPGRWIRVELQLRRSRAQRMIERLAASSPATMGQAIANVILSYISFREGEQTAGKRWRVAAWWLRLIGAVQACALGTEPKMTTIEQRRVWVRKQVAPTLALLELWEQDDFRWILDIAAEGRRRLTPRDWAILAAAS